MKVNESTYENYFLLYIDNELTAAKKLAVEAFVLANPNYAKILNQLQQSKLVVTDEVYEDKALLYKFEEMEACLDNKFKQTLYRTEAKLIKPVFNKKYYALAMSVAALFVLYWGYQYLPRAEDELIKNTKSGFATIDQKNTPLTSNEGINKQTFVSGSPSATNSLATVNTKKQIQPIVTIPNQIQNKSFVQLATARIVEILPNTTEKPYSINEPIVQNITTDETTDATKSYAATSSIVSNTSLQSAPTNSNELNTYSEVEYTEINTAENDRSVYISSFEIDSDKFRGITRRVSSLFKKNKTDKEK